MEKKNSFERKIVSLLFLMSRNLRGGGAGVACPPGSPLHDLSHVQLETLRFIEEKKNPLMREVSDYLAIAPPSLTPLVDNLCRKKLVKKGFSRSDRRAVLVGITDKGKTVLKKATETRIKKMKFVFKALTREERSALLRILQKAADQNYKF